jgi:hypothetical protein
MAELTKRQRVFLLGFMRGYQLAGTETRSDGGLVMPRSESKSSALSVKQRLPV